MSLFTGWIGLFGPAVLRKLGIVYPQRPVFEIVEGAGITVGIVDNGVDAVSVTIAAQDYPPYATPLVLSGTGSAAAVNLVRDDAVEPEGLTLADNTSFSIRVRFLGSKIAGANGTAHEIHEVLAHTHAGTLVIDDDMMIVSKNDPAWSMLIQAPGGLKLRFRCDPGAFQVKFGVSVDIKSFSGT